MAHILRIADLLDIDSRRTPLTLYELVRPSVESDSEWRQHFIISNINKIECNINSGQRAVVFYGNCKNANTHRKLLTYFSWIDDELKGAIRNLEKMEKKYWLNLKDNVEVNIKPEGYSFSNHSISIDFKAITTLLMGEHIYGQKSLGLRELIQNSIDACKLRLEYEEKSILLGDDDYIPTLKIIIDSDNNKVFVKDNGIGMSEDVIKKYFLNVGKSYYISDEFTFRGTKYKPIGSFGIGFLSCFMLSKNVTVKTRAYESKTLFEIEMEQGSEFICLTQKENATFVGTEVILNYNEFIKNMRLNIQGVMDFVKEYFIFDKVNCQFLIRNTNKVHHINNSLKSISKLDNSEIFVDLSKYLNDIEAYAIIRKKGGFITKTNDLTTSGEIAYYDDEEINIVEEKDIELKNIYDGEKFKYLKIPVYYSYDESEFEKALEYLEDDLDATLDKFTPEETIELFASKSYQNELEYGDTKMNIDFNVTNNHTLKDIMEIQNIDGFCPQISEIVKNAVASDDHKMFMAYSKRYYHYIYNVKMYYYVRNVLIKNMSFNNDLPSASIFELKGLYVNITNEGIVPDISRNNLDEKQIDITNYAISKAIHLAIYDKLDYNEMQKALLLKFINKFYKRNNSLLTL